MTAKRVAKKGKPPSGQVNHTEDRELVILTGMSGSGKDSALKAFEDLGYYSVDNLPLELVPRFADLVSQSAEIERAALVVDVREGMTAGALSRDSEAGAQGATDASGLPGGQRRRAGAAVLRDAAAASDGPRRDGAAWHPRGTQAA